MRRSAKAKALLALALSAAAAAPAPADALAGRPSSASGGLTPPLAGRLSPGSRFTPFQTRALLPGRKEPSPFDLGALVGSKPILICYWVPGERSGEEALVEAQTLARGEWAGRVETLGAVRLAGGTTLARVVERAAALKIEIPVIVEESYDIGGALGIASAPSLSLVDGSGVLRVADARSFRQPVAPGETLAGMAARASRGETVPTVARLAPWYPASELVGTSPATLRLAPIAGGPPVSVPSPLPAGGRKIRGIWFWHPDCGHCKNQLPGLLAAAATYGAYLDVVSVVNTGGEAGRRATEAVVKQYKIPFPVLDDDGGRAAETYRIVSTPTMIFITPDGSIDSVYTSSSANYVPIVSAKIRSILKLPSRLQGSRPSGR
ncbi:MAG TPA: TlpA disulfide reductase family protein [Candidatus Polarisedimenticolia bacterium]|nr:TlpA disulfide reductase family protein [Candidatus Polarisedimenticolia bacterium]